MKKRWLKILAMALVGVMMLCMTACDQDDVEEILPLPTEEVAARAAILEEINAYRTELGIQQLKEEPELTKRMDAMVGLFEEKNSLTIMDSEFANSEYGKLHETLSKQQKNEYKWCLSYNDIGIKTERNADRSDWILTLNFEYSDRTTLRQQIRSTGAFTDIDQEMIGISFVQVNGQIYWACNMAHL